MEDNRKIELFDELLFYIREIAHDADEIESVLQRLGFSEKEMQYYRDAGEI